MDGVYRLIQNPEDSINNGKPVYQHSSSSYYLYSTQNKWGLGPNSAAARFYQNTQSAVDCPTDLTGWSVTCVASLAESPPLSSPLLMPSPPPPPAIDVTSPPPPSVSPLSAPSTEYVEDHNAKRQLHEGTNDLVYDAELAAASQAYAESCPTGHGQDSDNHHGSNGENLYWAGSSGAAPDTSYNTAVESWYSEIMDYAWPQVYLDPRSNGGAVIGHFTQVVWKASTKVGCGKYTGCTNKFSGPFKNSAVVCRCARLPRLPPPHFKP